VKCAPHERAELAGLADIFRGRVVDVAADSVIVEITGDAEKLDGLLDLLRPRGIIEMVRTGKVAMLRGTASMSARTAATELAKGA
jgi:acetolactate synthase I/III small subunit